MRATTYFSRGVSTLIVMITMAMSCAPTGSISNGPAPEREDRVVLRIRNDNWYDMRVYEVRPNGGIGARLATVTSMTSTDVQLRRYTTADGFVSVLLRPIGGRESYVTNRILLPPGSSVLQLTVTNNLRLTQLYALSQ